MIESAVDDSHRTIAARALNKVKSSTFIILKNDHDTVGMGIFIAPDLAVTSNHVVVEVEDPDNIFALLPAEKQKLKLTCQFRDYRYDYAILPFPGTPLTLPASEFCMALGLLRCETWKISCSHVHSIGDISS